MEWSDYLKKLIEDENNFDGITLSLDGGANVIAVPPIIRASIFMLDKMLENQGKYQVIVFPEKAQSTFIFSIVYLIHNIIDGKIKQKYDPHSFVPGEKLKIGNAVVEFVCFEFYEGKEYIKIKLGDNSTVSMALIKAPILQKTDTSRKLSPYKTYAKEIKKVREQNRHMEQVGSPLAVLTEYKTHMMSSVYSVTPVAPVKEKIADCYLCGTKLTQLLMLSTVDYEGKMQSLGAGQAAGIPAMVYASDLYAVNTALEDNPLPQSVLIDVSNMNNIGGQLDELDDLIRRNIPIICLTDTMNSFELDLLKQREFNIWRWDAASITEQLYDASAISMDQKVKFCAQQKINYIKVDGQEISSAIQKISAHRRETQDASVKIMKVYSRLYNLSFTALQSVIPFGNVEINLAKKSLEECKRFLQEEKPFIKEQLYEDYCAAVDDLDKVYSNRFNLSKVPALTEFFKNHKHTRICIIVPERTNKKATLNYWQQWIMKSYSYINITVLFPGEYYAAVNLQYDFAIVVGWLKRAIMRKLIYSYNTQTYVVLLYDYENQWQRYTVGRWGKALKVSDNEEIMKQSFSTKDFDVSSSRYKELSEVPIEWAGSAEDEQEDIELVLRENTFRRYINGNSKAETVNAIPISYVGGYVAFYRVGHKLISATAIIVNNGKDIKTILPTDLKTGDFIVVREVDKDIIRELADIILENSGMSDLRSIAGKWREVLEIEMLFTSINEFYQKLVNAGCTKGLATVKRWIEDDEIIAPQQKQDLEFIAEVTQSDLLKEMMDDIYNAAQEVKRAHMKAGRILSQQLHKNLAEELKNYGKIDPFNFWEPIEMEIEGIGTIKVLKVIDVGNAVMVDVADTNRLIDE